MTWLQSNNAHEGRLYKESFERKWPLFVYPHNQVGLETYELLRKGDELSLKALENFSAGAASRLFDQEIREVVSAKLARIINKLLFLNKSLTSALVRLCDRPLTYNT